MTLNIPSHPEAYVRHIASFYSLVAMVQLQLYMVPRWCGSWFSVENSWSLHSKWGDTASTSWTSRAWITWICLLRWWSETVCCREAIVALHAYFHPPNSWQWEWAKLIREVTRSKWIWGAMCIVGCSFANLNLLEACDRCRKHGDTNHSKIYFSKAVIPSFKDTTT